MNKKYVTFTITLYSLIVISVIFLFNTTSTIYATMFSIFIPILFGLVINYNEKQKEIFNTYYEPIYHYIRTYYDILSQPYERINMGKKHEMMSKISRDLISFLNSNLKYASEEVKELLGIFLFYEYEYQDEANEFQDINNINRLIPILSKEILENYNVLYINHFIKRRYYMRKEKYHKANGLVYNYIDSFILDLYRRKEYALSLYEVVEAYNIIVDYRAKNIKSCYKVYRYIKHNRNKDLKAIILKLDDKFKIKVKKIKRK